MGKINILDEQSANMIAAGEVVDRPSGALKELLENAVDAGAGIIRVSVKGGGSVQMTVSDNGEGIAKDDLPRAVLRHATSKIKSGADIEGVMTLGFRGEALAAIAAVSRLEIISRRRGCDGYMLEAADGRTEISEVGCPEGTTVIINDLFYNTPARRKFLKRDATEAASCTAVTGRLALSHPEISFSVTVDGAEKFRTAGDGDLYSAIYSVYGRDTAAGMRQVSYLLDGVEVTGYVCAPEGARGSRSMQVFYVNGRAVNSKTISAALEEACRSYIPTGRFPASVLFVKLDPKSVDVNVHPAKTEIKFADEKQVFSAVYYAVKNTMAGMTLFSERPAGSAPAVKPSPAESACGKGEESRPSAVPSGGGQGDCVIFEYKAGERKNAPDAGGEKKPQTGPCGTDITAAPERPSFEERPDAGESVPDKADTAAKHDGNVFSPARALDEDELYDEGFGEFPLFAPRTERIDADTGLVAAPKEESYLFRYVGELYDAFLVVQTVRSVYFIDKHALHERILYEKLAAGKRTSAQQLLVGIPVTLTDEQTSVIDENREYLADYGFSVDVFGDGVIVRAVPSALADIDRLDEILERFASELAQGNAVPFAERCDRALFTVACKAALKAGVKNDPAHNEWLAEQFFKSETVRYCPHGRPFYKEFTRREIERFFDR